MSSTDLSKILKKLEDIEVRLDKIESSCSGMDKHIGFVDNIYMRLKAPIDWVLGKFERKGVGSLPPAPTFKALDDIDQTS